MTPGSASRCRAPRIFPPRFAAETAVTLNHLACMYKHELNNRTIAGQFALSSVVFKRTLSFAEKLIEVSVALRKELDFDLKGDEENYKRIVRQAQEQAVKEMDQYIADIARVVDEKKNAR